MNAIEQIEAAITTRLDEVNKLREAKAILESNGHHQTNGATLAGAVVKTFTVNPAVKQDWNERSLGNPAYPDTIELRRKIMAALDKPRRAAEIEHKLGLTGSTLRNQLEALKARGFVRKEGILWARS